MVFTHRVQSEPVGCVNTLRARLLSWAMLGSNQRPPRCQRGALPLRQSPSRRRRESNPRTGLCRPLPKPLGHSASANVPWGNHGFGHPKYRAGLGLRDGIRRLRADDGIRTRDPHLGKVMLYQLSHVRMWCTPIRACSPGRVCVKNCSRSWPPSKLGPVARRQVMRADHCSARRALATRRRAARWPGRIPGSPRWPGAAPRA